VPRWPSSLRARLTLWYSLFLAIPLALFAFANYYVFERAVLLRTDRFIADALVGLSNEVIGERKNEESDQDAIRHALSEVRFRDLFVVVADTTGQLIATSNRERQDDLSSRNWPTKEAQVQAIDEIARRDNSIPWGWTFSHDQRSYRLIWRRFRVQGIPYGVAGLTSQIAADEMLARIRQLSVIAIPFLVLAAATGGYQLAKRSLLPVAAMATQAAKISETNLQARLPLGGGTELEGLGRVFNDLLDRLERSFEQQRRFMADASHELRTPVTIVRTESDVTLSREHREESEYRASMAIIQDASRRLTRIVDDLFLLARADSGHLVPQVEEVYLEEVVADAAQAVRPVAEQRSVRVEVRNLVEAPFRGDGDLLGRVLLNLLDNAIKHSPPGGVVEIGMASRNQHYQISVIDAGEGIPADIREKIFERFFRADVAREAVEHTTTSGAGLGLAIARKIAELHDGRLEVADSRPGRTELRLTLTRPAS
jgi:heavy metal sensor kinase